MILHASEEQYKSSMLNASLQPARGWCATVRGVTMQIVPIYPASPEARPPSFLGEASRASPAAWLVERLLLAGDIESNPGPKPTLKPLSHTRTQPPTLNKYTNLSVHPPQSSPPPLYLAHSPPKSPTSVQPPHPLHQPPHSLPTLLTEYNLHVPTLPTYSHHTNIHTSPPLHHPSQLFTSPHPHTVTHETNKISPKQNTKQ